MAAEKTKKYVANWRIEHDGETCEKGGELQLAAKAAAPLLQAGAISDPSNQPDEPAGEGEA